MICVDDIGVVRSRYLRNARTLEYNHQQISQRNHPVKTAGRYHYQTPKRKKRNRNKEKIERKKKKRNCESLAEGRGGGEGKEVKGKEKVKKGSGKVVGPEMRRFRGEKRRWLSHST